MERPEQPGGGAESDRPGQSDYWNPPAGSVFGDTSAGAQPPSQPRENPAWLPPSDATYQGPAGPQQRTPGNAVASLVLGIVGLVLCPIICSVLAIIFGQQARQQIERDPGLTGAGLATAGYIMGIVGLALYGLLILFWVVVVAAAP